MPEQNTVGYVLLLDTSGSMSSVIPMVVIDAKAFVRQSLPGDQFGIVQFNTSASGVYPTGTSPTIVTVSSSLTETAQAATAIQSSVVATSGFTDMADAIGLANALIGQATTDVTEFVILSDGQWTGTNPATVLGSTPPIAVAGLGPYLSQQMYQPLLSLNSASTFQQVDNAYQMIQLFNDIRAQPAGVALTVNSTSSYSGSDYTLASSTLTGDSDEAQFTVVWSDSSYQYTSGTPSGNLINVVLIEPNGNTSTLTPTITDAGYCIFNVASPAPGTWQTLVQYSVSQSVYGTCGGFEINTSVELEVDAPTLHDAGEPLRFTARVLDEGQPVEGLVPRAHVTRPALSVEHALERYAGELRSVRPDETMLQDGAPEEIARLATLRRERAGEGDILATTQSFGMMRPTGDGGYALELPDTAEAGSYSVRVHVNGSNPATGKSFSRVRGCATLVG